METIYKNILVVGANFNNKGAQSMLFITMDEIRKHFPNATIYFATANKGDFSNYKFEYLFISKASKNIALGKNVPTTICKAVLKDSIKILVGRGWSSWRFLDLRKVIHNIDLIIDISGFNIGQKWNVFTHEYYMDNIRLARKYNIPIYLMPQSFGPFNYPDDKKYLIDELAKELPYCNMIFAREKEGYQMLLDTFHLNNVVLSTDLVLQNTGVNLHNIYRNAPEIKVPRIKPDAVGIVPNNQCFRHGDKRKNIKIYKAVIEKLLEKGKEVYIFRHSSEDLDICREIFGLIPDSHVHLLENDFSCLEYDEFIRQFDFIICSRYHGNVHAYRNCVPSVLLGWAIKYKELAELLGQGEYSFDITDEKLMISCVVTAIEKMCERCKEESDVIRAHLMSIQKDNCFEIVFR